MKNTHRLYLILLVLLTVFTVTACAKEKGPAATTGSVTTTTAPVTTTLAPGIYDKKDNLIASWDELVNTYGLDVEKYYDFSNYEKDPSSPHVVFFEKLGLTNVTQKNKIKLVIGDVKKIGSNAFTNVDNIYEVIINDGVEKIGAYAFSECSNLESVVLPESIKYIGREAFGSAGKLDEIHISSMQAWCSIDCESYFVDKKLYLNGELVENLVIPYGITTIKPYTFCGFKSIKSVVIPNTVTTISGYAFNGCTRLEEITIPDSVTIINGYAFAKCIGLKKVNLSANLVALGECAFSGCESLTSIVLPEGLSILGGYVFGQCTNLKSITIPSTVTMIDVKVFSGCNNIVEINVSDANTNYKSVNNCLMDAYGKLIVGTQVNNIPEDVSYIGDRAYYGKTEIETVILPNGVLQIGDASFAGCANMTSISIPKSVIKIEDNAFSGCLKLASINYSGTIEEWNAVDFEDMVKYTPTIKEIICTDGVITLD